MLDGLYAPNSSDFPTTVNQSIEQKKTNEYIINNSNEMNKQIARICSSIEAIAKDNVALKNKIMSIEEMFIESINDERSYTVTNSGNKKKSSCI